MRQGSMRRGPRIEVNRFRHSAIMLKDLKVEDVDEGRGDSDLNHDQLKLPMVIHETQPAEDGPRIPHLRPYEPKSPNRKRRDC